MYAISSNVAWLSTLHLLTSLKTDNMLFMECITDSVHESIQLSLALREPTFRSIDDQNIRVSRVCHKLTFVGLLSRVSSLIWLANLFDSSYMYHPIRVATAISMLRAENFQA